MDTECVYLIRELGTDYYKIGRAKNVKSRSRNLQTGNANRLEIVYQWTVTGKTDKVRSRHAKELESWLHFQCRDYRVRGEWFRFESLSIINFLNIQLNTGRAADFGICG